MRHATMLELAAAHGVRLPDALLDTHLPELTPDERGWFRFQRLYDAARSVLQHPDDVRRLVREVAEDERADGSHWLEIQVDPSGYAARFGGITAFLELVLDAVRDASAATGVGIAVVVGANRTRHPMDARVLARLAAQYAGRGVVGFGLANDERRAPAEDFERAFRIARRADLLATPHGGELLGAASVRSCVTALGAQRIGHGVRSVEDPAVLDLLAGRGITCEVCPSSNVGLGVYPDLASVPLRQLLAAGVPVALGADDPLLFGARLAAQYTAAREAHGLDDATLAGLARSSVRASRMPEDLRRRMLAGIDGWLAADRAAPYSEQPTSTGSATSSTP
jgi:adenosine deaminase